MFFFTAFFFTFENDLGTPRVILDAPLLIESGLQRLCSVVIVISIPKDIQLQRLILRNEFSENEAKARIESQMPFEAKLKFATDVIENSGSIEELRTQVDALADKLEKKSSLVNRTTVGLSVVLAATVGCYFYFR
jgi:dephospho-CoA kinase